jgi:hypothetical protein
MPKELEIGKVTAEDMEEEDIVDEAGVRGQLLWIRGLSRLQHQVRLLDESIKLTRASVMSDVCIYCLSAMQHMALMYEI